MLGSLQYEEIVAQHLKYNDKLTNGITEDYGNRYYSSIW